MEPETRDVVVMTGACVLGAWVSDFVRETFGLLEEVAEVHQGDGDTTMLDLGRPTGPPRALILSAPGRTVMALIARKALPAVIVLDDPADSVRYGMATRALPFLEALRAQTRSAASQRPLFDDPAVLVVTRNSAKPARVMLAALLAHLRVRVRIEAEAALLDRFAGPEGALRPLEDALAIRVPRYCRLEELRDALSGEQIAMARHALGPLADEGETSDAAVIGWDAPLFQLGDRPAEPARGPIKVQGAPRPLFTGPGFYLPTGHWDVSLVIAVSTELAGRPFRLLLSAGGSPRAQILIRPPGGGSFEGRFALHHTDWELPIDIQLANEETGAGGALELRRLAFTRRDSLAQSDA